MELEEELAEVGIRAMALLAVALEMAVVRVEL